MNEKENEIVAKVRTLFHKYGIKSITMDDVSHELGISKKTLYEHFSDKSQLVRAVVDFEVERYKPQIYTPKDKTENAIQEMFRIFNVYLQMLKEHFPSFEFDLKKYYPDIFAEVKLVKREKIRETTLENLKKGKREGFYRESLNEDIISKFTVLRIENLSESDLFTREEIFSREFSMEMFLYHLYGILNLKGIEYLNNNLDLLNFKK